MRSSRAACGGGQAAAGRPVLKGSFGDSGPSVSRACVVGRVHNHDDGEFSTCLIDPHVALRIHLEDRVYISAVDGFQATVSVCLYLFLRSALLNLPRAVVRSWR